MQGDVIICLPDFSTKPKKSPLPFDSGGQTRGRSRLMFQMHFCNQISSQRSQGSRSLYQLPFVVRTVDSVKKKKKRHDGDADDILQRRKQDYFNLIPMKNLFILNEIKQSSFPRDPGRIREKLVSFKANFSSETKVFKALS